MRVLFIGPHIRSGMGHVMRRYASFFGAEFCDLKDKPKYDSYDIGFVFILPMENHMKPFRDIFRPICKQIMMMCVCETETVHEDYRKFLEYQPLFCPSEYCRRIFERQFGGDFRLFRHTIDIPKVIFTRTNEPYTFYAIGNCLDYRKNTKMLIEAFIRLERPDCHLLFKATTLATQRVPFKFRNVRVIEDILSEEEMEIVHQSADCYVNCSFSEGVGMGAVEAAARGKPVIITDYGGTKEYLRTPFIVDTKPSTVGMDDFYYTKDMIWSSPTLDTLLRHMRYCVDNNIRTWDHEYLRHINEECRRVGSEYMSDRAFADTTQSVAES